jgi:acetyl esterase/lipase
MSEIDWSKIRPEISEIMKQRQEVQKKATEAFLKENKDINFNILWKKVMEGAQRYKNHEDLTDYITKEEKIFLAKFHRFSLQFRTDEIAKINRIPSTYRFQKINADGIPAEKLTYLSSKQDQILMYIHGGAYFSGSISSSRWLAAELAKATETHILSIDYGLAPEDPYPFGLEDCVAAYTWLLSSGIAPKNIVICGSSAGGYFTLLTLLTLRDRGVILPAGAICLSPATDLARTGTSYFTNAPTDPILGYFLTFWAVEAYLDGADPKDPKVSPLYADLSGLPPILIQVSKSEMLYDDSIRFADKAREAGVKVTLQEWDDTLHVFQGFPYLPESKDAIEKIGTFVRRLLN